MLESVKTNTGLTKYTQIFASLSFESKKQDHDIPKLKTLVACKIDKNVFKKYLKYFPGHFDVNNYHTLTDIATICYKCSSKLSPLLGHSLPALSCTYGPVLCTWDQYDSVDWWVTCQLYWLMSSDSVSRDRHTHRGLSWYIEQVLTK